MPSLEPGKSTASATRFGRSSEKLETQVEQLELVIDLFEEGAAVALTRTCIAESDPAEATETGDPSWKKRKPSNRAPLPDHLRIETIVHEAPRARPAATTSLAGSTPTSVRC